MINELQSLMAIVLVIAIAYGAYSLWHSRAGKTS